MQADASFTLSANRGVTFGTNGATINVSSGFDLTYGGIVAGAGDLTKTGLGRLVFSGANTYLGVTTISAGIIRAQNGNALGAIDGGTVVRPSGALELSGGIAIGAETLTLTGQGINLDGALRNVSGDNSYGGVITLTAETRINSDSGTLSLTPASGNAIAGNFKLNFGGVGNVTVSAPITIGGSTLNKDGSGTLTLAAANTYSGATTVSAGTLKLGATGDATNTPLGTVGSGTTVASEIGRAHV